MQVSGSVALLCCRIPDLLRRVRADADPGDGPDDVVPGSLLHDGGTASPASVTGRVEILTERERERELVTE